MSLKKLSRGTAIDTEQCIINVGGNRFDLVLIASARAKEISRQHRHAENRWHVNSPVTALLEIQEGKIGKEYLKRV